LTTPPLPNNLEAEQALLGSLLFDNEAFERLPVGLNARQFYEPFHGRLFAAIEKLVRSGRRAEPIILMTQFESDPAFVELGGVRYLADLVDRAPPGANATEYGELVADMGARRDIVHLAHELGVQARDTSRGSSDAVLAALERGAADIARQSVAKAHAVPAGLSALDNMEAAWRGEYAGASVGLDCIDRVTGGIRQDDVWIFAGRTSMGKSAVALSIARGIAERQRGVMIFSLEMPLREVQARLVSDIAYDPERRWDAAYGGNIGYGDLLKGRGDENRRAAARAAARSLASLPITVTDVGGVTIDDIRAQALRQVRAWERAGVQPGAIIIDHLGLVRPVRRTDNKAADTSDTVNELKGLAKQLRAPIVALAQINRSTENRNDKRPTLSDMNWSGSIEQIADFICLLYRDAYYLERSSAPGDFELAAQKRNEIELLIAKNRSGPICNLKAFIDVACNALRDKPEDERRFG
jgi:replicative DNA helicase